MKLYWKLLICNIPSMFFAMCAAMVAINNTQSSAWGWLIALAVFSMYFKKSS